MLGPVYVKRNKTVFSGRVNTYMVKQDIEDFDRSMNTMQLQIQGSQWWCLKHERVCFLRR